MGVVVAAAFYALTAPVVATAQEADISTTVASIGSSTPISRINFDAVKPRPATDRRLQLPFLAACEGSSSTDLSISARYQTTRRSDSLNCEEETHNVAGFQGQTVITPSRP
jgi:hypothetical protein